jgi:hypothetical protein
LIERTQLAHILQAQLGCHAARTKLAVSFVLALLRLRTVTFPSLALCLNPVLPQEILHWYEVDLSIIGQY